MPALIRPDAVARTLVLALAVAVAVAVVPAAARGEEPTRTCAAAYENAQLRMNEGALAAARAELRTCAADTCHPLVRGECQKLVDAVDQAQPTVVVSAERAGGGDVLDASLRVEGEAGSQPVDGKAIRVDPGRRALTVTAPGFADASQVLMVRSGEKNRVVRFVLAPRPSPHPESPPPRSSDDGQNRRRSPWPMSSWILGGAGVVALGVASYFYVSGFVKDRALRHDCAPNCSSSDIDQVRHRFVAGDVALAVAALSFGAAIVVITTSSDTKSPPKAADATLTVIGRF
jgi:hypothetical protein